MPWWIIAVAVCLVIGPFDALYMYIKASRRRDEMRRREAQERRQAEEGEKGDGD